MLSKQKREREKKLFLETHRPGSKQAACSSPKEEVDLGGRFRAEPRPTAGDSKYAPMHFLLRLRSRGGGGRGAEDYGVNGLMREVGEGRVGVGGGGDWYRFLAGLLRW